MNHFSNLAGWLIIGSFAAAVVTSAYLEWKSGKTEIEYLKRINEYIQQTNDLQLKTLDSTILAQKTVSMIADASSEHFAADGFSFSTDLEKETITMHFYRRENHLEDNERFKWVFQRNVTIPVSKRREFLLGLSMIGATLQPTNESNEKVEEK